MDATQAIIENLKHDFDALVVQYKADAKDGMSVAEIWSLALGAVASLVRLVEGVAPTMGGADKKTAVLQLAASFYDQVLAPLDIPYVPEPLERMIVDPTIKKIFLQLVGGSVDRLVQIFNRTTAEAGRTTTSPASPKTEARPSLPSGFTPY
jgi:hypothetical protein